MCVIDLFLGDVTGVQLNYEGLDGMFFMLGLAALAQFTIFTVTCIAANHLSRNERTELEP